MSPISGVGFGITKGGDGTLTLGNFAALTVAAADSYTSTTTVNAGTLLLDNTAGVAVPGNLVVGDSLGGQSPNLVATNKADVVQFLAGNQIATNAAVTVNSSGLLNLNNQSDTIGTGQTTALTITGGTVATGTGTLTVNGNISGVASTTNFTPATITGNLSFGGSTRTIDVRAAGTPLPGTNTPDMLISAALGNGSLTKTDGGVLRLAGSSPGWTGTTTVTGGTLYVDGSQAGSPTVVSGGILGGTGTIGSVTQTGGTIEPGDPAGNTVNSAVTSSTGTSVPLTGAAGAAASLGANLSVAIMGTTGAFANTVLSVGGPLTIESGATLTVNLAGLDGSTGAVSGTA